MTSEQTSYGAISRLNHWIITVAVIAMIGFGLFLANVELDRETRGMLMGMHKAVGVLVLIYALWRVAWRLALSFPQPAAPLSAAQAVATKAVHWALMVGILVLPISGIVMSLYGGHAIDVFGLVVIPAMEKSELIHEVAETIHAGTAYVMIGLIGLHVAATLKHHFIDRDATLVRMVSGATTR